MAQEWNVTKAAAVQAEPVTLDREATIEKACSLIDEAAAVGARLIVFPELFVPTYVNASIWGKGLAEFGSPRARAAWTRLWQNSVEIPSAATERLGQAARRTETTVVMGLNEREANTRTLYNTVAIFGPDGAFLGRH